MTEAQHIDVDAPEQETIDRATQHRYRVFKKNSPYLYDYISTNSLLWPSLLVQFFPDSEEAEPSTTEKAKPAAAQLAYQRLLLGTFTLGQAIDSILIQQLPYYRNLNLAIDIDHWNYNTDKEEFELPTVAKTKLRLLQSINHAGDVNKLRYMPQNPDVIASANNKGDVLVYNRTKHSTIKKITDDAVINEPQLRLVNTALPATGDIFALDWNKQKDGTIAVGAMDGTISMYDIRGGYATKNDTTIAQSWTEKNPIGINDLEWIPKHDSVFVTADDGGTFAVFDTRAQSGRVKSHTTSVAINSIGVNPHNNFCVATGDAAGAVKIWDLRAPDECLNTFAVHADSITQVKWHPKFDLVLGSCSADRLVKILDAARTDPLVFSHEGHMLGVNDFDWSLHEDWMVASVADDNSLHLWKPASTVIHN